MTYIVANLRRKTSCHKESIPASLTLNHLRRTYSETTLDAFHDSLFQALLSGGSRQFAGAQAFQRARHKSPLVFPKRPLCAY